MKQSNNSRKIDTLTRNFLCRKIISDFYQYQINSVILSKKEKKITNKNNTIYADELKDENTGLISFLVFQINNYDAMILQYVDEFK